MARRQPKRNQDDSKIRERINSLARSPLKELARRLGDLLSAGCETDSASCEIVGDYVSKVLERFPSQFEQRFFIDSFLIQSITLSWSQGPVRCSQMILPTYRKNWKHERIFINSIDGEINAMDFVHMNCEIQDSPPWLLDYPWLFHELGHYLLQEKDQPLSQRFNSKLDQVLANLRMRSIADRETAKSKAEQTIEMLKEHWLLSRNESGWAKEIIVDVIAVWSCGPAYLAAYQDQHEAVDDPFLIEPGHPPVELRTIALLQVASHLGWRDHLRPLEELITKWNSLDRARGMGNLYRTLRHRELINEAVSSALDYCKELQLPRLTTADLDQLRLDFSSNVYPGEAVGMIVGAWLVHQDQGDVAHDVWAAKTIEAILPEIMP